MNRIISIAVSFLLVPWSFAHAHCPTFGGGIGIAGPVTTFSAPTVPEGKGVVGLRVDYIGYTALTSAQLDQTVMNVESAHSLKRQTVYSLGGVYGLTDDLTVGLQLPYVSRDGIEAVHIHGDTGMSMLHDVGDSDGIGDAVVFGEYRVFRKVYEGIDISILGGLKTPTGKTGNASGGARIETEHQPGSGSWDPLLGIALSKRSGRLSLHTNFLYTVATTGSQHTNLGDRMMYNATGAWRIGGNENYGECDEIYEYFYPDSRRRWLFDLVLELNGERREKVAISGVRDNSTGGDVLYVTPGLRMTFDNRWSAFLAGGVPVYQHLNGNQSRADYRITAGLAVGL